MRRLLGYLRYDTAEAREAINDLYRRELRLFQNLFLPSVKLAQKERVGSRLRRRYQAPQTPLQRLAACGVVDRLQVAELERLRQSLDPFQLSAAVEAKRRGVFALSREAPAPSMAQRSQEDAPVGAVPDTPAVVPPARGQPQDGGRSSSGGRNNGRRSAVEMTRRGKRGKLQEQRRVSHASLRPWKSGQKPSAGFPHSHSAGRYG